jgi:uncharacterized protein YdeI (YjbR/CyaY-like superfamily)
MALATISPVVTAPNMQIISFETSSGWEAWLENNHASAPGVWLRIFKKDSGQPADSYVEALDGALCYGWIDGQKKSHDTALPVAAKVCGPNPTRRLKKIVRWSSFT